MNYPLISEYIEAIKSADDNFEELSYLRPVLGDDGLPVMTGGNFAEVFKMMDVRTGKLYAIKCFTKEQNGRAEAYKQISKELKDISSPYLTNVRYIENELFVDTDQTKETEFPVLLMDWVEGKTLDKYLRENLSNKYAIEMLAYRFCQMAQWLLPQHFAHGDLKPDNIIVREDGKTFGILLGMRMNLIKALMIFQPCLLWFRLLGFQNLQIFCQNMVLQIDYCFLKQIMQILTNRI